ncbi:MAG: sugar phosphate nucleotidyltransferase [Spirochaetaceae bacterium]
MKGLIIAAGYGTRFLPVTKTVPKEMLPLITKPSISFIVEEFLQAGIREIVIVSSRRKRAIEDFFDREVELEELFTREGASQKLEAIAPYNAHFSFVRQQKMMGTGDALLQAEPLIGDEPFVTAYPDDLHFGTPPLAQQLVEVYKRSGASVMASLYDPPDLSRYGVLSLGSDGEHVVDIVEKPAPGSEPSREASIGRYLFTPDIFPLLREGWEAHRGKGEYYHTYALKALMNKGKVVSHRIEGKRLDTGTPEGYLEAILTYASSQPSLRDVIDRFTPGAP